MVLNRIASAVLRGRRRRAPDPVQSAECSDEDFEASLRRHLESLKATGLDESECATYALRCAAGTVHPVDIPRLREVVGRDGIASKQTEWRWLLGKLFASGDQLFLSMLLHCRGTQADMLSDTSGCSQPSCPIDLGQVHQDLSLFCPLDSDTSPSVENIVTQFVKTVLPQSLQWSPPVATAHILAALILLPQSQEVSHQDSFLEPLLALFSAHRDAVSGPLRAAFARCRQSTRTAATFAVQQFLTLRLYSRSSVDAPSITAVHVLAALHAANTGSAAPAPSETFHNDVINSRDFNLHQDWVRSRQTDLFSFSRYPFLYGPAAKARLLRCHAVAEMREGMAASMLSMGGDTFGIAGDMRNLLQGGQAGARAASPHLQLNVRRGPLLLEDTLSQIQAYLAPNSGQQKALRRPLRVKFVEEQGIDEGGISREFFQLIVKELMDSRYGLFTCDPDTHAFWIRPSCVHQMLDEFELIGVIVGLAIHNGHILSLSLARALYKKLLGAPVGLEDLQEMHAGVYSSLKQLLAYDVDRVEADMCLSFQISHEIDFETIAHDLVPKGHRVPVTGTNRRDFVDRYVQFLLVERVAPQFDAFERGFSHVCDRKLMEMFRACPHELEEVICGTQSLAFDDLKRSAQYDGGITAESKVVKWLWEILEEFSEQQKRRFLQFVTGADRAPVGGLGSLSPQFKIMKNGGHSSRLPTAHVCFNILLLPQYDSKQWLADRLEKAIENDHGFGLM
eukprot:jgi/Ulvmu1/9331/UM050_0081.1